MGAVFLSFFYFFKWGGEGVYISILSNRNVNEKRRLHSQFNICSCDRSEKSKCPLTGHPEGQVHAALHA